MEATLSKYKDALKRAKERVLELQAEKVSKWVWSGQSGQVVQPKKLAVSTRSINLEVRVILKECL